jgi:hypothetical protein
MKGEDQNAVGDAVEDRENALELLDDCAVLTEAEQAVCIEPE